MSIRGNSPVPSLFSDRQYDYDTSPYGARGPSPTGSTSSGVVTFRQPQRTPPPNFDSVRDDMFHSTQSTRHTIIDMQPTSTSRIESRGFVPDSSYARPGLGTQSLSHLAQSYSQYRPPERAPPPLTSRPVANHRPLSPPSGAMDYDYMRTGQPPISRPVHNSMPVQSTVRSEVWRPIAGNQPHVAYDRGDNGFQDYQRSVYDNVGVAKGPRYETNPMPVYQDGGYHNSHRIGQRERKKPAVFEPHVAYDRGNNGFQDYQRSVYDNFGIAKGPRYETNPMPVYQDGGYHDSHRIGQREQKKPAVFDGTGSFRNYIAHFELVARINGWSDATCATELALSLRGSAQSVLSDLSRDMLHVYEAVKQALTTRYEPGNQSEIYRAQMKGRVRRRSEPLHELAQDVKTLARQAYPAAIGEVQDALARDCFVDALNDPAMELYIFQAKATCVDEALSAALQYEAFVVGRARRAGSDTTHMVRAQREEKETVKPESEDSELERLRKHVDKLTEAMQNQSRDKNERYNSKSSASYTRSQNNGTETRKCFYCHEIGHLSWACKKFKSDLRRLNESNGQGTPQTMVDSDVTTPKISEKNL